MMHERGGAGTRPLRLTMVTGKKEGSPVTELPVTSGLGMLNHA